MIRTVMIADVVGSAAMPERVAFGRHLAQVIRRVNRAHAANLQAPIAVAKGIDTLTAILASPGQALELGVDLMLATRPQFIRVSLARGVLDVNPRGRDPRLADGPAFHAAQDQIERLEHEQERIGVSGYGPQLDAALCPAAALLGRLLDELTPRQAEIIFHFRRLGTQEATAAKLGVTRQAISDAWRKARADLILRNLARLTTILESAPPESAS